MVSYHIDTFLLDFDCCGLNNNKGILNFSDNIH